MIKILFLILFLVPNLVQAAPPTRAYTYVSNTTIDPNQNNTNENALYSYLQVGVDTYADGSITGADISASASIPYNSLSLAGSIVNADISASAGIVGSKLNLTAPGIIGSITPSTGQFTNLTITGTLNAGVTNQGDIFYDNGTSVVRLTPGTSGQVLKTQGAIANPIWSNSLSSVSDYGTSTSSSTARQATSIKVAYGTTTSLAGPGGTFSITNLPFTNSTSYIMVTTQVDTGTTGVGYVTQSSGSAAIITNASVPAGANVAHTFNWFAWGI